MPTSSGFFAVANSEKLVIVQDQTAYMLANPLLTQWALHCGPPQQYFGSWTNGMVHYFPNPNVECELRFACHGGWDNIPVPADLRFADDMTVRELLAAMNRKLLKREPV